MTLSNQTSKNVFVGDGATVLFSYTFRIFADADLLVTIQDTSVTPQTEITLVLTSDYTVTGADDPSGGTITLLLTGQLSVAPSATDNITIQRALPLTQPTDYVENDPFPADSHEDALDRSRMIDQQLQEELDRSIKLAANITGVSVLLPTPEADAPIGWNSAADGLTNNPSNTNLSQIDSGATPDFIGATGGDGVIRVSGLLTYVDGGDFVTIGITSSLVDHDDTLNFTQTEHFTMLDEDAMGSNSDTQAATQQSIVAFVASQVATQDTFIEHSDTPGAYAGSGLFFVRVNAGATALEFVSGVLNVTHTGEVTGATVLTIDPTAITNKSTATVASLDEVLIADVDDSDNLKVVTAQSIADLGAGGGAIEVFDEGGSLTAALSSLDFVGAGVTATNVGSAVTVTIPGGGGGTPTLIEDADQNTKVQTEESADENIIRFDTAGVERATIDSGGLTIVGSTPNVTIGDAGAEDTSLVFDGNAQDYYIGLDDTDDNLKIGLGSVVGTTPHIITTPAGEVTKPLHPMFSAYLGSAQDNLSTGNTKILFDTERHDIGSNFNTTTNRFTAPVDGHYYLATELNLRDVNNTLIALEIIFSFVGVNNNTALHSPNDAFASATTSDWHFAHSMFTQMSAGHTVEVQLVVTTSTIIDVLSGTNMSSFFGWLVG